VLLATLQGGCNWFSQGFRTIDLNLTGKTRDLLGVFYVGKHTTSLDNKVYPLPSATSVITRAVAR